MFWLSTWNERGDRIYVYDLPFDSVEAVERAWRNLGNRIEADDSGWHFAPTLSESKKLAMEYWRDQLYPDTPTLSSRLSYRS